MRRNPKDLSLWQFCHAINAHYLDPSVTADDMLRIINEQGIVGPLGRLYTRERVRLAIIRARASGGLKVVEKRSGRLR